MFFKRGEGQEEDLVKSTEKWPSCAYTGACVSASYGPEGDLIDKTRSVV